MSLSWSIPSLGSSPMNASPSFAPKAASIACAFAPSASWSLDLSSTDALRADAIKKSNCSLTPFVLKILLISSYFMCLSSSSSDTPSNPGILAKNALASGSSAVSIPRLFSFSVICAGPRPFNSLANILPSRLAPCWATFAHSCCQSASGSSLYPSVSR